MGLFVCIFIIVLLTIMGLMVVNEAKNGDTYVVELYLYGEYREQSQEFKTYSDAEWHAKIVSEGTIPYRIKRLERI